MSKTYSILNISERRVIEMQEWLYPKLADPKLQSMAEIIDKIIDNYTGDMRHYALYHLGYITAVAREKEENGQALILNPSII